MSSNIPADVKDIIGKWALPVVSISIQHSEQSLIFTWYTVGSSSCHFQFPYSNLQSPRLSMCTVLTSIPCWAYWANICESESGQSSTTSSTIDRLVHYSYFILFSNCLNDLVILIFFALDKLYQERLVNTNLTWTNQMVVKDNQLLRDTVEGICGDSGISDVRNYT